MYEFKLPDLGEGIHEGEILKWHVQPGDIIKEDEPLVEIETDKAAVTIPSPKGGRIVSITGKVGDMVTVGQIITVIDETSDRSATTASPISPTIVPLSPVEAKEASLKVVTEDYRKIVAPVSVSHREKPVTRPVPAAPATRRLARELGIDIRQVTATGPAGRVTPEDVQRFAAERDAALSVPIQPTTATVGGKIDEIVHLQSAAPDRSTEQIENPHLDKIARSQFAAHAASAIPFLDIEPLPDFSQWGPVEKEPLRSIRRKVAHKMVTSMILIPHVAHMDEADVTLLEEFRKKEQQRREGLPGGHLTLLPFIIKAVTAGLRTTPAFNASLDPFSEEIIYKKYYHLGIAVDTGKGLIAPVIRDTDRKSIMQISRELEDMVKRAREGKLEVTDLRGGTFTITNVGPIGGTALIPTINYPEVAILGMGRVQEKPVVRDGQIVIRKMLPLTLAFDHRIADGADAARFVTEMVRQLSDPNLLLLET